MARNVRRNSPSGILAMEKFTVAHAMGTAGTATVTAVTMTVTGLVTTDLVLVNPTAAPATGICLGDCWVSGADELTVELVNPTAAAVAAGTMTLFVNQIHYNN